MSRVEDRLLREYAWAAGRSVALQVAAAFKKRKASLSGEDSGLTSVWSEICVQIRDEESPFWDAYEFDLFATTESVLLGLPLLDRVALFLDTEDGWHWLHEFEELEDEAKEAGKQPPSPAPEEVPVSCSELARHIVREYVRPLAMNEQNEEVDDFFAARYVGDDSRLLDEPDESSTHAVLTEQAEPDLGAPPEVGVGTTTALARHEELLDEISDLRGEADLLEMFELPAEPELNAKIKALEAEAAALLPKIKLG